MPAGNPVVTGTLINSTWANATMPDIGQALTNSIAKDGQTTPTANLPMGGNRHTGVSDGNLGTQYASINQSQNGSLVKVGSVANATDAYTGSVAPAIAAYTDGLIVTLTPSATNTTTTVTLALNGLTVKPIQKEGGVALAIGDLVLNVPVHLQYTTQSSGYFMLLNPQVITGARVVVLPDTSLSANVPLKNGTNVFGPTAGVSITVNGIANSNCISLLGSATSGQSFGLQIKAGTTSADYGLSVSNQANTLTRFQVRGDGVVNVGNTTDNAAVNFQGTGTVTISGAVAGAAATFNGVTVNAASGPANLTLQLASVTKAFVSVAASTDGIITGSVSGDLCNRSTSGSILWSVDAGTTSKMKLSSAGVLTIADGAGTLVEAGFRGLPQNSQSNVNYTCVLSDAGKSIVSTGAGAATFTIPSNASVPYPIGTTLTFATSRSGGGTITIAITSDTLVFSANNTTGSRTLVAGGMATALKIAATEWLINGGGLS